MTKRSPVSEAVADANPASWADAGVEPTSEALRLAPEQPEHGLLWVTRGSLTLTRAGRAHEVRKGTVIAYRLGGGLAWSAPQGTHVRWCAREVGVAPGQVAPWTSDLVLDGPVPTGTKRRPLYLVATVAVAWLFAIAVAWCYDMAHAQRLAEASKAPPPLESPEFPDRAEIDLARAVFFSKLGEMPEVDAKSSGGPHVVLLASLPPPDQFAKRFQAALDAAKETYARCPRIKKLAIAFGPEGVDAAEPGRYFLLRPDGTIHDYRLPVTGRAPLETSGAVPTPDQR
jgi:hypothetical protein